MNLSGYGSAVLAAFIACSITDWLFMGVLFHARSHDHPEIWRAPTAGTRHRASIALSIGLNLLTCAVYLFSAGFLGLTSISPAIYLAVTMWLAIAVPLLLNNGLFIKIHPLLVFAHALGWLAKLVICSLAGNYFL